MAINGCGQISPGLDTLSSLCCPSSGSGSSSLYSASWTRTCTHSSLCFSSSGFSNSCTTRTCTLFSSSSSFSHCRSSSSLSSPHSASPHLTNPHRLHLTPVRALHNWDLHRTATRKNSWLPLWDRCEIIYMLSVIEQYVIGPGKK